MLAVSARAGALESALNALTLVRMSWRTDAATTRRRLHCLVAGFPFPVRAPRGQAGVVRPRCERRSQPGKALWRKWSGGGPLPANCGSCKGNRKSNLRHARMAATAASARMLWESEQMASAASNWNWQRLPLEATAAAAAAPTADRQVATANWQVASGTLPHSFVISGWTAH